MKRNGIINSHISKVLTDLGHTDYIVIADLGLPIPEGVKKIDLSLRLGVPRLKEVIDVVSDDMVIEKVVLAQEIKLANQDNFSYIRQKFSEERIDYVSHEEFKKLTKHAKAVIRTGEATPYANCILQAGVIF